MIYEKLLGGPRVLNVLGLLRILLCAFICEHTLSRLKWVFTLYLKMPLVHENWVLALLPGPAIPPQVYHFYIKAAFLAVSLAAVFGVFTRLSLLMLVGFFVYIYSLLQGYGIFDHEVTLGSQVLFILAFSPGAAALSVDRLVLRAWRKPPGDFRAWFFQPTIPAWPVKLMLCLVALTYLTSGVSKIRYTGWRWLDGSTLAFYLSGAAAVRAEPPVQFLIGDDTGRGGGDLRDGYGLVAYTYGNWQRSPTWVKVGKWLSRHAGIMAVLATCAFFLELAGPLMLLGGWWRNVLLVGLIGLHIGIGLLMGLPFTAYKIINFLLLDWTLLVPRLRRLAGDAVDPGPKLAGGARQGSTAP